MCVLVCSVCVCEVYESDVSLYEVSLCVYNTNMQQQNDIATPTTAKNNKNILTAIVIIDYIYIYRMIAIDICIRFYRWTLVKHECAHRVTIHETYIRTRVGYDIQSYNTIR